MVTTPNQGPATASFTPPTSCLATTMYTTTYSGAPAGFTLGTDLDCFPPPTSALVSPGVCPVGYTYATPYTRSISGHDYDDSVTRYVCCPDTYTASLGSYFSGDVICKVTTDFVPYATASNTSFPSLTAVATFAFGDPTDRVKASPIIVAWQKSDAKVLAALSERGVSPDWPPAVARERMIILLSILIPVGVILLAVAAWLYRLKRKGRLHPGQVCLCWSGARKHAGQPGSEASGRVGCEKPELPAESRHLSSSPNGILEDRQPGPSELHAEAVHVREADSRRVVPEADSKPLRLGEYKLHSHSVSAKELEGVSRPQIR